MNWQYVEENWTRLATDLTHYNGSCYLTLVDCGPSRFAVWRKVSGEDAVSIVKEVDQLFRERGPPEELLMDNGASFRSQIMRTLLSKWQVRPVYRAAYRPAGNGIVERNHRTIKRMAARTSGDPLTMVYWYNSTPKDGIDAQTVPANQVNAYKWRVVTCSIDRDGSNRVQSVGGNFVQGDKVYVKPPVARCISEWLIGTVTDVQSATNVEVNGIPRHVADIRPVPDPIVSNQIEVERPEIIDDEPEPPPERPRRLRRVPERFGYDDTSD